jgi:hypothetical protein
MKNLLVVLSASLFLLCLRAEPAHADEKENMSKSSALLKKFATSRKDAAHEKENQALLVEVVDSINAEITPYPSVSGDKVLKQSLFKLKTTCRNAISGEPCIVAMNTAFDMAVDLVNKEIAKKKR